MIVLNFSISCTNDEINVFFPDPYLKEVREHNFIDKENLIISTDPIKTYPLKKADELICILISKSRKLKEDILDYKKTCTCN